MNPHIVRAVGPTEMLVIVAVITAGCATFVSTAWKARSSSWSFKHFFLGGRNIGPELTEQSSWGLTFAWANGIWFFAALGYAYGPGVILLQIPWCISVALLAILLRHVIRAAKDATIHGYLGERYGAGARKVACIATSIGYVFNCGFEMYWAARIFSLSLGQEKLIYPAAIALSGLCGAYCMVGGYIANCRTDKHQNILGMFAMTALCGICAFALRDRSGVVLGASALVGICFVYGLLALVVGRWDANKTDRIQNCVAVLSVPVVLLVAAVLVLGVGTDSTIGGTASAKLFASSVPPWQLIVGITVFQLFFNFVDMANWQTISANAEIPVEHYGKLKWSFVRSAAYMLWFPALSGILIGCFMRVFSELGDDGIFPAALAQVFPDGGAIIRGLIIGLIMLGLFSTSLSSADSYIMAAAHTLSWDLVRHDEYRRVISLPLASDSRREAEAAFVEKVRTKLIVMAVGMTLVFAVCHYFWPTSVFAFQFIMYGSALALFPGIMYALKLQNETRRPAPGIGWWVIASIVSGIVASLVPYVVGYAVAHLDLSTLTPVFTLAAATSVFLIGWAKHRDAAKETNGNEDTL